jgi:hypothetical protein
MKTKLLQRKDIDKPLSINQFDNNYLTIEKVLYAINEFLSLTATEVQQNYPEREGEQYVALTPDINKFLETWKLNGFFSVTTDDNNNTILVLRNKEVLDELGLTPFLNLTTNEQGITNVTGLNTEAILSSTGLSEYFKVEDDKLVLNNTNKIKSELQLSDADIAKKIENYVPGNVFKKGLNDNSVQGGILDNKIVVAPLYIYFGDSGVKNDIETIYGSNTDKIEEVYVQADLTFNTYFKEIPLYSETTLFFTIVRDADTPENFIIKDNKVELVINKLNSFSKADFNVDVYYEGDNYCYIRYTTDLQEDNTELSVIPGTTKVTSRIVGVKYKEEN